MKPNTDSLSTTPYDLHALEVDRYHYEEHELAEISRQRDELKRDTVSVLLANAAQAHGAKVDWIDGTYAHVRDGEKNLIIAANRGRASRAAASLVTDKWLTKQMLLEHGIPTPEGLLVNSASEARQFQLRINRPIVLKPRFGFGGTAVSVNLTAASEISQAFEQAAVHGDVIAEEFVPHEIEFRCLASSADCVSVIGRLLPQVSGDGSSTINDLIIAKNKERDNLPSTYRRPIPIDTAVEACLANQSLTLSDVLAPDESVIVREVGGLTQGGEPVECLEVVDPQLRQFASRAVEIFPGLEWAGIDIIMTPDGTPLVVEVNTSSGLLGSHYPQYGKPQPVASYLYQLRLDAAPRAAVETPSVPTRLSSPKTVLSERAISRNSKFYFSTLMRTRLSRLGWTFEKKNDHLTLATHPTRDPIWLQRTATQYDLNVARKALNSHSTVLAFLDRAQVQRSPSTALSMSSDFKRYKNGTTGENYLLPASSKWDSPNRSLIAKGKTPKLPRATRHSQWILQLCPHGRRFKLFATPNEVVAVISENTLSTEELDDCGILAVSAVRAIPELRWAWIDIVIPDNDSSLRAPVVEGFSIDPIIDRTFKLIAGSMNATYLSVIDVEQ